MRSGYLPRLQKTSGGSTASSSEDELGGDGDDVFEAIGTAVMVGPRIVGDPTRPADAADDGCIAKSHLKMQLTKCEIGTSFQILVGKTNAESFPQNDLPRRTSDRTLHHRAVGGRGGKREVLSS